MSTPIQVTKGLIMMDLTDHVALVTGAARGQGRAEAIALSHAGADVIAIDRCSDVSGIPYSMATRDDLDETVDLIRVAGRRAVPCVVDVRDLPGLRECISQAIDVVGDIDVVVANAGVVAMGVPSVDDEDLFRTILEVNLTGVWHTLIATVPSIINKGRGGSIIITSSAQGLTGRGGDGTTGRFAYAATKHGVVGLMRSAANAYAKHHIRVNSVHPNGVATPMVENDYTEALFAQAGPDQLDSVKNLLDVSLVEPYDIADAVVWLASPSSRYITGVTLPVDAGHHAR